MFNRLFQPITINHLTIPNRIVMAPMATRYASFNGFVTKRMIAYYQERAKGGVGLIQIEAAAVSAKGIGWKNNLAVYADHFIPGLQELAQAIHVFDTKVTLEIFHTGREAPVKLTGEQAVAPSAIHDQGLPIPRELSEVEIGTIVNQFGQAARRAKAAGFDAVTLHMAHGYLINQFLSPLTNRREDRYGGSIDNRFEFAREVIDEVRRTVGQYFPVFARLTADEGLVTAGITPEESRKIASLLEKAGMDLIDVSAGAADKPYLTEGTYSIPEGFLVYLSRGIKEVVDIPVSVVGKIRQPEMAEAILKAGDADLIVLGRPLIADPHWANKVKNEALDEILPCIGCLQGCGRLGKDLEIACTVNSKMGREGMFSDLKPTQDLKTVLVVGAGLSGVNVALDLAECGHDVHLVEKTGEIGGQFRLAAIPEHKKFNLEPYLKILEKRLKESSVKLQLNKELDQPLIEKLAPDVIVQATGGKPRNLVLDTDASVQVMSAWDVLRNGGCPGEVVAVIGAGEVGLETTEFLVQAGKKVHVFEVQDDFGMEMRFWEKRFLLDRLQETEFDLLTQAKVKKVEKNTVYFERGGLSEALSPVDCVILAIGTEPNRLPVLRDVGIPVINVGDCISPGRFFDAINSGSTLRFTI